MRVRSALLAGLVLLAAAAVRADEATKPVPPPADEWDAVPVVPLRKAAGDGSIKAVGQNPRSYTAVTLKLVNQSKARVAVELSGSWLGPRNPGSCQRLAIGPPLDVTATIKSGGGSSVARLEPGETREIVLNTCCMDAGLPGPDKQHFDVSPDPLPPVREKVMRWWVDNPTASQNAVNCAIWDNSPTVRTAPGVVENYSEPKGRFTTSFGGVHYRLIDGLLTSVDADGLERVYGAGVFQALPADTGLFAVKLAEEGKPALWKLETTGESRWTKVLDLDGSDRVRQVIDSGKGGLVVLTDKSVLLRGGRNAATIPPTNERAFDDPSVRADSDGKWTVLMHQVPRAPVYQGGSAQIDQHNVFGLWELDPATGKLEFLRRSWEVGCALACPGGVFALTPTEHKLRRLVGEKFVSFGPAAESYARIVGSSADALWLVDEAGKFVAVETKTAKVLLRTGVAAEDRVAYVVDPKTGDVVYVRGKDFLRLSLADGQERTVEPAKR